MVDQHVEPHRETDCRIFIDVEVEVRESQNGITVVPGAFVGRVYVEVVTLNCEEINHLFG